MSINNDVNYVDSLKVVSFLGKMNSQSNAFNTLEEKLVQTAHVNFLIFDR